MDWRVATAQHAAERTAALVHREMAQGLDGLATVAATAPFLGMLGTLNGIYNSFSGGSGEKTALMAAESGLLSLAIIPTALGLAVAIIATCGHRTLKVQLADFDLDMANAVRQLPGLLR